MDIIRKSVIRHFCNNIHHPRDELQFNKHFNRNLECYSTLQYKDTSLQQWTHFKQLHPDETRVLFDTLISKVKETKICNRRIITVFKIEFSVTNKMLRVTLHRQMNGVIPHQLKLCATMHCLFVHGVIRHQIKFVCYFALCTDTWCYSTPNKICVLLCTVHRYMVLLYNK